MSTRISTKCTGAFSFQNAFFYLQWADDLNFITGQTQGETSLITLRKTRRRTKLHPHKQRSKYVCQPRAVVEAGNHFIWEFIPGFGTVNVSPDTAILHHYRVCEFGGDDCTKSLSVVDRTALKYFDKLTEHVNENWKELSKKCLIQGIKVQQESLQITYNKIKNMKR